MRKPAPKAIGKAQRKAHAKATKKPARKAKATVKASAEPAMDLAVGRRIRELRRTRQLSLETVVARTDLSIGFVSQIERGLSSPSLRVLATLADVLGVGIAALFGARPSDDGASGGVVTREAQRAELKLWRSGISKQLLSPAGAENRLNLFLVHLEPGGSTGDESRRQLSFRQPPPAPVFESRRRRQGGGAVGELRDAGELAVIASEAKQSIRR
jgi:transcriptional regulator with XRE-family HTH domain